MTPEPLNSIRALLKADVSVSDDQATSILRCCKQTTVHRRLIKAKDAMEILGISRPTLRAYVNHGHLKQYNFSSRKARFDADEVQRFANNGATA